MIHIDTSNEVCNKLNVYIDHQALVRCVCSTTVSLISSKQSVVTVLLHVKL